MLHLSDFAAVRDETDALVVACGRHMAITGHPMPKPPTHTPDQDHATRMGIAFGLLAAYALEQELPFAEQLVTASAHFTAGDTATAADAIRAAAALITPPGSLTMPSRTALLDDVHTALTELLAALEGHYQQETGLPITPAPTRSPESTYPWRVAVVLNSISGYAAAHQLPVERLLDPAAAALGSGRFRDAATILRSATAAVTPTA